MEFATGFEARGKESLQDNPNDTPEQKQRKVLGKRYNEMYKTPSSENPFDNVDYMITGINIMNKNLTILSSVLHALIFILKDYPKLTPNNVDKSFKVEYNHLSGKDTSNEKAYVNLKLQFVQNLKYMIYELAEKGALKTDNERPYFPENITRV